MTRSPHSGRKTHHVSSTAAARPAAAVPVRTTGAGHAAGAIVDQALRLVGPRHRYWARLKNDSGEFGAIIANDNLVAGAKGSLTIAATDKFVEFNGGCTWVKA
ncbi:hypothetical protein [Microlunatus sp. Y2014]|uniref:hypothetical protein n=1 Tax=Microlunatus sp. Y2014 TaxID=3418488 RepID=UPI003DA75685